MFKDLRTLIPYIRRYIGAYVVGCICLLISNGLSLLIPWLIRLTIRHLKHIEGSEDLSKAHIFAIVILVIAAVQMIIRTGSRWYLLGNSRRVAHDLRNDLFAHLQNLSPSYYVGAPTGDLMSRAVNDMQYVQSLVGPVILYCASTIIIYLGAIPVMLYMNVRLTLLALIPYPIFLITFKRFASVLFARSRAVQERLASLSDRAQESISGIQIIKAYAQEESTAKHFRKQNMDYFSSNIGLIKMHALFLPMITIVSAMGMLVVIWVGAREVIGGRMMLEDFYAFTGYLALLAMPTAFLGMIISASQRGLSALRRINEIFEASPSIADHAGTRPLSIEEGEIEIRNLNFSYPPSNGNGMNHRFALTNIDLHIPAGTTLAIVGRTGSGKTTLINLIARLLEVDSGKIFIDGSDIVSIPLAEIRKKVAVVPQESFLFSITLKENIAFGVYKCDVEDVESAARVAGLMEDVELFPKRFETLIGERGVNLSGGQRQRTALARAIMAKPRILILDDSFSSVDTHTEEQILENLENVLQQRTAIMISHRVSTIKNADKIVVMDEGRIVEEGTHESLVKKGGIYADLYRKQLLMEELEQL